MNKSESKYFNTALRMNEALLALLERKDLEYITVKELCQQAGVNRSTFYLHYETIGDLVSETVELVNRRFLSYFPQSEAEILSSRDEADLILVSRAYLLPYLRFIRDNRRVYRAAFRNPDDMGAYVRYGELKQRAPGAVPDPRSIPPLLHRLLCGGHHCRGQGVAAAGLRRRGGDDRRYHRDLRASGERPWGVTAGPGNSCGPGGRMRPARP